MRLLRLKIEQLRQFRQSFELSSLQPGLNLFAGPNEAGKSTLVRAIRAAFFERHRSTSMDDLLPWGEPSAAPTVELDFSLGSVDYRLRKTFMNRKRCELKGGVKDLDGEDAEQHLADLLGFRFPGKGLSKAEHWGIPGLLWIEQGSAQDLNESVSNATNHLRKALDQSVSEVASTLGDGVIAQIRAERDLLLTTTGRPRGAYADVLAERDSAAKRAEELAIRISQYRQMVDELGRLRAENDADAQAKPWEALRLQQQAAEARLSAIQALTQQLETDHASVRQLDDSDRLINEQLAAFDEQHRALKQREAALVDAESTLQSAQSADETWGNAKREAEVQYQQATDSLALARQEDLRSDLARRIVESQSRITALTDVILKAEAEQAQLQTLRTQAVESEIDSAHITKLQEQDTRLKELRIRREAVATRVRFEIDPTADVTLAEQRLSGAGEQLLTAQAELNIAGVGKLLIVPGGADLAELAREESEHRAAHRTLLQRVGAASLMEAEARHATHQQALKDLKYGEKALVNLAPKGVDALRSELTDHATRKADAETQLAPLGAAGPDRLALPLAQATAGHQTAAANLDQVAQQAATARQVLSTAGTKLEGALRERDTLKVLLGSTDRRQREQEAAQRLLALRAERNVVQARVLTRQSEVDTARPEILVQDVERFKRSADQAERALAERQTRMTLTQGRLEEAGAQGLEEERADLLVRLEAAERRCGELKLRADALDLLLKLLEGKRRELTRRLQAPLQKHVGRYLQLLFPQATLDIGEDLVPGILTRAGLVGVESGPVMDLSFGAREQMGVISRLAYADLLKEAGRPTLIILDDALVHSDDQRLEQMKRVLFDAAQRHQVLLFTCHPGAWRDMGVAPRTIQVA